MTLEWVDLIKHFITWLAIVACFIISGITLWSITIVCNGIEEKEDDEPTDDDLSGA